LRAGGGRALFVATDVTVEADVERLVQAAVAELGRLDGAFDNAGGVTASGPVHTVASRPGRPRSGRTSPASSTAPQGPDPGDGQLRQRAEAQITLEILTRTAQSGGSMRGGIDRALVTERHLVLGRLRA
jgi:NAD(P)-dependent dehydrogenase (short-subunit alcohol dehydrogenase family)